MKRPPPAAIIIRMNINPQIQMAFGLRLLIAALLGGVIGLERERRGQDAGIGTFAIVALGACAFSLGAIITGNADTMRVAAGVIQGIGFLGAGLLIRGRAGVHGLTTAAGLWASASIGLLASFGLYVLALITTTLILLILIVREVRPVAQKLDKIRDDARAAETARELDEPRRPHGA